MHVIILNQVEEVVNGDYLIIETENGTNIIDFRNFVVGPNNVSFYTAFATLSTQVVSLSGAVGTVPNATKAATATGTAGQISYDVNYIYICVATNTWKRAALTGSY